MIYRYYVYVGILVCMKNDQYRKNIIIEAFRVYI